MARTTLLASTAICALCAAGVASAQDAAPAVSALNGKASVKAGGFDDDAAGIVEGSISTPIAPGFGFQADGMIGGGGDGGLGGVAGHVFWRDPSLALAGAHASFTTANSDSGAYTHFTIGAEGEYYLGDVTLSGLVGYEGGDDVESGAFFIGDASYYLEEDLKLTAGLRFLQDELYGAAGAEYQFMEFDGGAGLAGFVDTRFSDGDNWQAFAGVRVYYGESKSLKARQREDDPASYLSEFLFEAEADPAPNRASAPTTTEERFEPTDEQLL